MYLSVTGDMFLSRLYYEFLFSSSGSDGWFEVGFYHYDTELGAGMAAGVNPDRQRIVTTTTTYPEIQVSCSYTENSIDIVNILNS